MLQKLEIGVSQNLSFLLSWLTVLASFANKFIFRDIIRILSTKIRSQPVNYKKNRQNLVKLPLYRALGKTPPLW